MAKPIYLDNQATTPLDPRVLESMMPFFTEKFGNPHSAGHLYGWETEGAIDRARAQIAAVVNAAIPEEEIIFTSGATEANNMAIKGVMQHYGAARPHLVTVATEHKCVLETAKYCERAGYALTVLPVNAEGMVDLDQVKKSVTEKTALVSVMAVNNEIGVIQDLEAISIIAHEKGALLHTDAAQAFGKIPMDVQKQGIDLMSISGHKIYGPKGIGALYKKSSVKLVAQLSGGNQENGLRAGTLSPALCVGMGTAAKIALDEQQADEAHIRTLASKLVKGLGAIYPSVTYNGSEINRWVGNLNLHFPNVNGDLLMAALRPIALSNGAACSSGSNESSYVLKALGLTDAEAKASLRMGLGRMTTEDDITKALMVFQECFEQMGIYNG